MSRKLFLLLTGLLLSLSISAQTSMTAGSFRSYATLHAIGVEWEISGDANHNGSATVHFRKYGTSAWIESMPLFRVDMSGMNGFSGSLLFLHPGTLYEVRIKLSDPDGGSFQKDVQIQTRPIPIKPVPGRTFHVVPGSGGGNGSAGNPFRGIEAAEAIALPGDRFYLHGGRYSGESEFNASGEASRHIVWIAAGDGEVSFETIRIAADYIWLEGLTVTGHQYGIRTYSNPIGVVITRNRFSGCLYCVYLNHGGKGWYIADNHIVGDVDPASGDFGGEGVELQHSSGHTVAFNTISRVADGVSYPGKNCDIYGNDIFDVSDDGIEGDYGYANIRIWGNRISNALHNGISFQPQNGAPWYILRNQVAAPLESVIKFRGSDRALIAHNTFVGWQGALKYGSNQFLTVYSRNNLWISMTDWYVWENGSGGTPDWKTDLDYDGFDWNWNSLAFKWGDRYADLMSFQQASGLEPNGIRIRKSDCLKGLNIPLPPPNPMSKQYIRLKGGCNAVDAGQILPGINTHFYGNGPDLGAYERGFPLPHYGVRPEEKTVTIHFPKENEALRIGEPCNIIWKSVGLVDTLKISLWKNQQQIGMIAASVSGTAGVYRWHAGDIVGGIADIGDGYVIKIKEKGTALTALSGLFRITEPPSIQVLSPNGGEILTKESYVDILWSISGVSGEVKIGLWQNGTLSGILTKAVNAGDGVFRWRVGYTLDGIVGPGQNFQIKIKLRGESYVDVSDSGFSIVQ